MAQEHQRILTSSLRRVVEAAKPVVHACRYGPISDSSWAAQAMLSDLNQDRGWDGNKPFDSCRSSMNRTALAGLEHGIALYELARSGRGYSVTLATVTRAAIESLARVRWVLAPNDPSSSIGRHGSIEHADLRYPSQHRAPLVMPKGSAVELSVTEYRDLIPLFFDSHGLTLERFRIAESSVALLSEVYTNSDVIYSGLSAAAHGHTWATGNFYDYSTSKLALDDQMLIEYCCYVMETVEVVCTKLIDRFEPAPAVAERWTQISDSAFASIAPFISTASPATFTNQR